MIPIPDSTPVRYLLPTFTGRLIDPVHLDPTQIDPTDIAHSLAYQNRWCGHGSVYYSVAEHSVRMARLISDDPTSVLRRCALLHDASETYWSDLPRPVKKLFPEYTVGEERCQLVIATKFGLPFPWPDQIQFWDDQMIHAEARWLQMRPDPRCQSEIDDAAQGKLELSIKSAYIRPGWPPDYAQRAWTNEFRAAFPDYVYPYTGTGAGYSDPITGVCASCGGRTYGGHCDSESCR